MKEVIKSGRGIRRLVTLAGTIQQLVKENDQRLLGERDGESEGSEDEDAEIPRPPLDPQELQRRSAFLVVLPTIFRLHSPSQT